MSDVDIKEKLRLLIEREGSDEIVELELDIGSDMLKEARSRLGLAKDVLIFERGGAEPLTGNVEGRRNLHLVAHSQRAIELIVRYEHEEKSKRFPPSTTVFTALEWAVGKHGYKLDPTQAAKANLILPGAEEPMPRDRTIGSFTETGADRLVVDLTLKDFTNG